MADVELLLLTMDAPQEGIVHDLAEVAKRVLVLVRVEVVEVQDAINRPSWSTFFCSDVRRTSDIMADIDVILNLLGSGKR